MQQCVRTFVTDVGVKFVGKIDQHFAGTVVFYKQCAAGRHLRIPLAKVTVIRRATAKKVHFNLFLARGNA